MGLLVGLIRSNLGYIVVARLDFQREKQAISHIGGKEIDMRI